MPKQNIVRGQLVQREKIALAKDLRLRMTPAEGVLWQALRRSQLNGFHFRRQQIIDGFIVDFYCARAGLVVEVDGDIHDIRIEEDTARTAALEGRGLRVLRVKNEAVLRELPKVLEEILDGCCRV